MPNLSALSRGTQLLAAAGVLLLIDTFLKWQSVDVGPFSVGQNAWNGFWGVIMGIALIVLLAWVIAQILDVKLPAEIPDGLITVGLGALVFVFALLKNLTDEYSTIWSYIGVVLAAGVALGAWLRYQEAGGTVESLRASMPSRSASTAGPTASSSTAPAAPAEPAPTTTVSDPAPPPTTAAPAAAEPAGVDTTTRAETSAAADAEPPVTAAGPEPAAPAEPARGDDERLPDAPPRPGDQT